MYFLKGSALSFFVSKDIYDRDMIDIDVLIEPKNITHAYTYLIKKGYIAHDHELLIPKSYLIAI